MKKIIVTLVLVGAIQSTQAEEPKAPVTEEKTRFIGLMAGPAFITSTGGGTHLTFGGRAGFLLGTSPLAEGTLGLAVNTLSESATISGITVDSRITFIGAEYVARKAFDTGLYFGARAGIGINSASVTGSGSNLSASDVVFAFAPVVGYEAKVAERVNLMIDAAWNNIGGGTLRFVTASIPYERSAAVAVQAGLVYEF